MYVYFLKLFNRYLFTHFIKHIYLAPDVVYKTTVCKDVNKTKISMGSLHFSF